MENETKFVKSGPDGERIERTAHTPAEAVKLRFEGFTEQPAPKSQKTSAEKAPTAEKPGDKPTSNNR